MVDRRNTMTDRQNETPTKHKRTKILFLTACLVICGLLIAGYASPRTVTVLVDDSHQVTETVYRTTARDVAAFLEMHDVAYDGDLDLLDAELTADIEDGMTLHITKAVTVRILVDDKELTVTTLPVTAGELLQAQEIGIGESDIVEPAPEQMLKDGDTITVTRVLHLRRWEIEKVKFQVLRQADPTIPIGDVQVTQKGRTGKLRQTYDLTYVEGEETERVLADTEILVEKRDKIYGYGTKILSGTPSDLTYVKKYEDVRAYAYHFSGEPRGSYGLPCTYGTVAVDPDLIPLGSLLYIEGYGYATANDVGSAVQGKVVDLYMEAQQQALLWGARYTTVYVVREGPA